MGQSSIFSQTKSRILTSVFDHISEAQAETLEILSDADQMIQMMTSLLEARTGQVVAFESAFADL